jgi:hypothetical protein
VWCQDNNLSLNVIKTKEMIVDYRKRRAEQEEAVVRKVERFKFLLQLILVNTFLTLIFLNCIVG